MIPAANGKHALEAARARVALEHDFTFLQRPQDVYRFVRTGSTDGRVEGEHRAAGVLPTFLEELKLAGLKSLVAVPQGLASVTEKADAVRHSKSGGSMLQRRAFGTISDDHQRSRTFTREVCHSMYQHIQALDGVKPGHGSHD